MNFRKIILGSGKIALAGRNAESNEELIKQAEKEEYVLHTEKPGSPFVNIKAGFKDVTKKDIMEAAVFCAKFSQAWKKNKIKKNIEVHYFLGKDVFKTAGMKAGTFGVKKNKRIIVKMENIKND